MVSSACSPWLRYLAPTRAARECRNRGTPPAGLMARHGRTIRHTRGGLDSGRRQHPRHLADLAP